MAYNKYKLLPEGSLLKKFIYMVLSMSKIGCSGVKLLINQDLW